MSCHRDPKLSSLCLETRGYNFKFVVIVSIGLNMALTTIIIYNLGALLVIEKSLSRSLSSASLVTAFNLSNSFYIYYTPNSLFISSFSLSYRFLQLRRPGRLAYFARGVTRISGRRLPLPS